MYLKNSFLFQVREIIESYEKKHEKSIQIIVEIEV
jgi:hypothetical protein